jgi:hypothetical protein
MLRRVALLLAVIPAIAVADPISRPTETQMVAPHAVEAQTASVLYFNRCVGGCTIQTSNMNDARTHASTIACAGGSTCPACPSGSCSVPEFHPIGADTQEQRDTMWNELMTCLKEVYSPYNVTITDVQPAAGVAYNENIVAGLAQDVGYSGLAGGVSPVTGDCSPFSYVISYSFANGWDDVFQLCYVAAQETGHAYGMADHSYSFISDGRSACSDPMSYRVNCLQKGQRFFRNEAATCGENNPRACNCSGMNSHAKLLSALGPGQSLIPAPTVSITSPAAGTLQGNMVTATAASKRGVSRVELLLNGHKWTEANGNEFSQTGQKPDPYQLAIPDKVPNSVIDIVVTARDDTGATTMSAPVRVTKGAACTDDASCVLPGMKCDGEGRCLWDPPAGELGDECTYNEFCKTGMCITDSEGEAVCSQSCVPGSQDSCPMDFECLATGAASGACWPKGDGGGGCCSSNRDALAQTGLLGLGLVFVLGRRRRRK